MPEGRGRRRIEARCSRTGAPRAPDLPHERWMDRPLQGPALRSTCTTEPGAPCGCGRCRSACLDSRPQPAAVVGNHASVSRTRTHRRPNGRKKHLAGRCGRDHRRDARNIVPDRRPDRVWTPAPSGCGAGRELAWSARLPTPLGVAATAPDVIELARCAIRKKRCGLRWRRRDRAPGPVDRAP